MTQTAAQAVEELIGEGGEPTQTKDEGGQELTQRPISIDVSKAPRKKRARVNNSGRIRVYNKRRSKVFCSDCTVGPNEEADILASDLKTYPGLNDYLIKVAR